MLAAPGQKLLLELLSVVGASLYLFCMSIVAEVTSVQPLLTLYLILSALPSLLETLFGKQQVPDEAPVTQPVFHTPLLLPQSQVMLPFCPDTVTAVKLPLASQKVTGPAVDAVPSVGLLLLANTDKLKSPVLALKPSTTMT